MATSAPTGVVLFLGVETANWSDPQFTAAAKFAASLGCSAIAVKFTDGTNQWYGGGAGLKRITGLIAAQGLQVIPYAYCYGNKYGALASELQLLADTMRTYGIVCADLEVEWNGQDAWGTQLRQALEPVPGILIVSTWADPDQQNWGGVLTAMAPAVNVWGPQEYTNWLATQESQFTSRGLTAIQPELSLNPSGNDPVANAQLARSRGHDCVWIWEYQMALNNPGAVRQIVSIMGGSTQTPPAGAGTSMLSISDLTVQQFFTLTTSGAWHCKQTNQNIANGILAFYQAIGQAGLDGLTFLGLPVSGEIYPQSGTAVQVFERGAVFYDPKRVLDNPPGASGDCYVGHIDSSVVLGVLDATMKSQLAAAQQALSSAQAQLQQAQSDLQTVQAQASQAASALQAEQQAHASDMAKYEAELKTADDNLQSAHDQVTQLTQQLQQAQSQLSEAAKGAAVVEAIKAALN